MNENQNEIQNENQEQSQEPHKHFLTLHISHKGQQKTLHVSIMHMAARHNYGVIALRRRADLCQEELCKAV